MSKTVDEEMQKLWEQATPEQKYIIVRFMRNIVKPEKTPGANHRFGRLRSVGWAGCPSAPERFYTGNKLLFADKAAGMISAAVLESRMIAVGERFCKAIIGAFRHIRFGF